MSTARELEPPNPVHMATGAATRWTTVNFAEAIQGVQTPLGWSLWSLGMETSLRRTFGDLGVFRPAQVPIPDSADERFSGMFFGRAAGNITVFRRIGDAMPGSSGDILEEKLFGKVAGPPTRKPRSVYARYPVIAAKMPRAARRPPRELPALRDELHRWWQRVVLDEPPADLGSAQALMKLAAWRFVDAGIPHTVVSMLGSQFLDALGDLAERSVGDPTMAMELATGYGAMEETALIEDLWSASRGDLTVEEVVRRHGYHGPDEGNLMTRTWREDPAPLEAVLRSYRERKPVSPREREREQAERRRGAEERLLAGLSPLRRPQARLTMKLARRYIPLREVGKASFLHTVDASRCAARAAGRLLAADGVLDDPEDIFFVTYDEFLRPLGAGTRDLVRERRARHERYLGLALPPSWTGPPDAVVMAAGPAADAPAAKAVDEVSGIGIVGDRVTGRARVVHDPAAAVLEDGDILVCVTTDPSWTPLFLVADALVIDTGGAMSHGAIVARELGVTCVINTVTGTRDIPDGATITVDGRSGLVTIDSR